MAAVDQVRSHEHPHPPTRRPQAAFQSDIVEDLTLVTVLGGISLDLSEAVLAPRTRITKVSLIGGIDLTVPAGTSVIVRGFSLLGGSKVSGPDPDAKNTVIVNNWGVLGGVSVRQV